MSFEYPALPSEFEGPFVSDNTKVKERMRRFGETLPQATDNVASSNNHGRFLKESSLAAMDARLKAEHARLRFRLHRL